MDVFALKHSIADVKSQLDSAGIDHNKSSNSELINLAMKALMLDELRALNKNLERLNDFNSSGR